MKKPRFSSDAPSSRRTLSVLAAVCLASLAGALIIGIDDNLPGIALLYTSAIALCLIFTRRWRDPKKYLLLAAGAFAGFVVFAVLHNVLYGLGELSREITPLYWLLQGLHVAAFMVALFPGPAALVVGLVGSLVCWIGRRPGPEQVTERSLS